MAVPRYWLAEVKQEEVETAVALPGSGSFDHAKPTVEVVMSVQEVLTLLERLRGDLEALLSLPRRCPLLCSVLCISIVVSK